MAGTAQSRPVIPCLSVIFTLFQHNHSEQPGVIALGMMNWAAWLYSAAGRGLTMIWHVALFGFLTEARHRALRRFTVLRQSEHLSGDFWQIFPQLIIVTILGLLIYSWHFVFLSHLGMVHKRLQGNWESLLMESPMSPLAAHPIRCWFAFVVTQRRVDCFISTIKVCKLLFEEDVYFYQTFCRYSVFDSLRVFWCSPYSVQTAVLPASPHHS